MVAARSTQYTGTIVGLAVGDALGYVPEFMRRAEILEQFGPNGVTDFVAGRHPAGYFTDDTQMSIAVANALLAAGKDGIDPLMEAMAREFVEWAESPDNDRAPGNTCMRGCANLARGVHWRSAGVAGSKGCGSAMRVAPIGMYYADLDQVAEVARASSILTHGHDAAIAGAAAAAIGVRMALDGFGAEQIYEEIMKRCADESAEFAACFGKIPHLIDRPVEQVLSRNGLGEGWVAEEAVASAMWCFLKAPDDYRAAVLLAVNTDGDSDSLAAITGSFLGARLGIEAIPEEWAANVEKSAELHALGEALFRARV